MLYTILLYLNDLCFITYLNLGRSRRWEAAESFSFNSAFCSSRQTCKMQLSRIMIEPSSFNLNLASHTFRHINHDGLGDCHGSAIIPNSYLIGNYSSWTSELDIFLVTSSNIGKVQGSQARSCINMTVFSFESFRHAPSRKGSRLLASICKVVP